MLIYACLIRLNTVKQKENVALYVLFLLMSSLGKEDLINDTEYLYWRERRDR